ncbi:MAG TPA: hypothetical protein VHM66_00845, partial [Solirubrobacterales bacterium]|nr:hypothetical protein [Solirubrobacterales bacterium]
LTTVSKMVGPGPTSPRRPASPSAPRSPVYEEVVLDRTAELPRLLPELTYELLVPFLGGKAARAEQRLAAAAIGPPAPSETTSTSS